jgi:hypothetical protein
LFRELQRVAADSRQEIVASATFSLKPLFLDPSRLQRAVGGKIISLSNDAYDSTAVEVIHRENTQPQP